MGFRIYRRIKVVPGVTVNISKSGPSVSAGPTGAKTTVGPRGVRGTVGAPGTGARYTTEHRWGTKKDTQTARLSAALQTRDLAVADLKIWKSYLKAMQRCDKSTSHATRNFEDGLRFAEAGNAKKAASRFAQARAHLTMADVSLRSARVPDAQARMCELMRQGLAERIAGLAQLTSACRHDGIDHLGFLAGRERYDSGEAYFKDAMEALE